MRIKILNIHHSLISLYLILTVLFPTFFLNKLVFVAILVSILISLKSYNFSTFSPFYIIFIFTYGMLISFFTQVERSLSNQFFISIFSLIIIYPILKNNINLDRTVKLSGLLLVIYSLISFCIVVVFPNLPISERYYFFFKEYSAGASGLREFTEEGLLTFRAGTVPFLFLSLVLYIESFIKKNKLLTLIVIVLHFYVIFMSGSRGTFFSALLATILVIFYKTTIKTKIVILAMVVPFLSLFITFLLQNTEVFNTEEVSNNIKLGHFESFIESTNSLNLITGNGLGAIYYTKGRGTYIAHTEITPIDMVRYFGIVMAVLLYFVIIFPTFRIKAYSGDNFLYMLIFMIYVLNSITNPTMFNSYGLIVVIWYWYKVLKGSQYESQKKEF